MPRFCEAAFANLCEQVTKGIIGDIRVRRTSHWLVPWANGGFPVSAYTNRPYLGELNVLILSCAQTAHGYGTARWATERQVKAMGGYVRSLERPTTILFGRGSSANVNGFGKLIQVFNVDQCEGLADAPKLQAGDAIYRFPRLERMVAATGIPLQSGGRKAFYNSVEDSIHVPPPSSFFQPTAWLRTVVHELAHATKHPTRLDRKPLDNVTHVAAAREEILAELAAAFVLAHLRLYSSPTSPSYIKAWLRYAKVESDYLLQLQPQAHTIARYLLAFDS